MRIGFFNIFLDIFFNFFLMFGGNWPGSARKNTKKKLDALTMKSVEIG